MANIIVSVSEPTINVDSTNNIVNVSTTTSNVSVSNISVVSNSQIRQGISVSNLGGFGNLAYDNSASSNGVIQYTGISNSDIYSTITTTNVSGYGNIAFDQTNGDIEYTGVAQSDIRGSISNVGAINYDTGTGQIGVDGVAIFTARSTDDLTEGSTNLYFSNTRVRSNISVTDAGGDGSLAYDNTTGVFTYTGPSQAEANARIAAAPTQVIGHFSNVSPINLEANGQISVDESAIFSGKTTDDLTEGTTNLYFTPARVRSNISLTTSTPSGAGALTYDNTTGVFDFTPAVINSLTNADVKTFIEANGLDASANLSTTANTSAAHGTFTGATSLTATGNVSIGGNLDVTGNINSETVVDLFVEDRNITLQYGVVGSPSANSQIFVDRGSSANTYILWDEGSDSWKFSNDGSTEYKIPTSTSDLAEGTNLYFTAARARGNISVTDSGGDGSLAYDSGTGVITYTGPSQAEVVAHFSNVSPINLEANGQISIDSSALFSGKTTDDLTEGSTNLYFTAARARGNISASGNIDYDSSTGVISESLFTQDITEGDNLYYTTDRANTAIGAYTGAITNLTGNVTTTANMSAAYFIGDGSQLTNVTSDVTSENIVRVCIAAETLAKGDAVYISGGTGDNPEVSKADADDAAKMPVFGVTKEAISSSSTGNVVIYGEITSFDTTGFTTGDSLFVSTTPGALQNTAPTGESSLIQKIGKVIKGGSTGGKITVTGAGRTNATPNLNDGNIFIGNGSNQSSTAVLDTSIVPENTNLYFTSDRANSNVTAHYAAGVNSNITTSANVLAGNIAIGNAAANAGIVFQTTGTGFAPFRATFGANSNVDLQGNSIISGNLYVSSTSGTFDGNLFVTESSTGGANVHNTARIEGINNYAIDFPLTDDGIVIEGNAILRAITHNNAEFRSGIITDRGYELVQTWGYPGIYDIPVTQAANANANITTTHIGGIFCGRTGTGTGGGDFPSTGTVTTTAGSPYVQFTGLSTADADGNFVNWGTGTPTSKTHTDLADHYVNYMTLVGGYGYPRGFMPGGFPVGTKTLNLISSDSGGNANVQMTGMATISQTYSADDTTYGMFGLTHSMMDNGFTSASHPSVALTGIGSDFTYKRFAMQSIWLTQSRFDNQNGANSSTLSNINNTFTSTTVVDDNGATIGPNAFSYPDLTNITAVQETLHNKDFREQLDPSNGDDYRLLPKYDRFPGGIVISSSKKGSLKGRQLPGEMTNNFGINIYHDGLAHWKDAYNGNSNVSAGMNFFQHTGNTFQASNTFMTVAGPRVMLGQYHGDALGGAENWYTRDNMEIGKYSWYGQKGTDGTAQSTLLPTAFIHATADGDMTTTDAVSVRHLARGTDGGKNAFLIYHDSNTSIGANGIITFGYAPRVASFNVVNDCSAVTSEWANVQSTGFYSAGVVEATGNVSGGNITTTGITSTGSLTATGNVSGGNVTTTGALQGDNTVLKKFNETVVALGNQSGDISSSLNANTGTIFTVTATGGITINSIANAVAGTSATIKITQDGVGSHALTSSFKFAGGNSTLSTGAGNIDVISVVYDGTDYLASLTNDYK
jgi:hypothetical protein